MGDSDAAVAYFEESVSFLMKLPMDDLEVVKLLLLHFQYFVWYDSCNLNISIFFLLLQIIHTLSVSLNKIGDLKYYAADLEAARSYYFRSLNVRRDAIKNNPNVPSQVSWSFITWHLLCYKLVSTFSPLRQYLVLLVWSNKFAIFVSKLVSRSSSLAPLIKNYV